jgi:hypothetical protein
MRVPCVLNQRFNAETIKHPPYPRLTGRATVKILICDGLGCPADHSLLMGEKVMYKPNIKSQRLASLFVLGCLLFNYPLLALFNRPLLLGSIPLLYVYVFAAWVLLIALLALVVEKT